MYDNIHIMSKSASIDIKTAEKLVREIESFEEIKKHILQLLPEEVIPYGSKLWWEKEMIGGEEIIKKGKYKVYKNPQLLISDLHKGI